MGFHEQQAKGEAMKADALLRDRWTVDGVGPRSNQRRSSTRETLKTVCEFRGRQAPWANFLGRRLLRSDRRSRFHEKRRRAASSACSTRTEGPSYEVAADWTTAEQRGDAGDDAMQREVPTRTTGRMSPVKALRAVQLHPGTGNQQVQHWPPCGRHTSAGCRPASTMTVLTTTSRARPWSPGSPRSSSTA